jgi:hypothetical protein
MTSENTRVVTLELDTDADPISGRMTEPGETSRPFVGWLGLAAALERVFAGRSPAAPPNVPPKTALGARSAGG